MERTKLTLASFNELESNPVTALRSSRYAQSHLRHYKEKLSTAAASESWKISFLCNKMPAIKSRYSPSSSSIVLFDLNRINPIDRSQGKIPTNVFLFQRRLSLTLKRLFS